MDIKKIDLGPSVLSFLPGCPAAPLAPDSLVKTFVFRALSANMPEFSSSPSGHGAKICLEIVTPCLIHVIPKYGEQVCWERMDHHLHCSEFNDATIVTFPLSFVCLFTFSIYL